MTLPKVTKLGGGRDPDTLHPKMRAPIALPSRAHLFFVRGSPPTAQSLGTWVCIQTPELTSWISGKRTEPT